MSLDDALANATIKINQEMGEPEGFIDTDAPVADELVASFFQLNPHDLSKADVDKINVINDYVKTKGEDRLDVLNSLRELRFKLGDPAMGTSKLHQVYEYVKLRLESQKFADQAQAMEA
jgi:hypothetical protein